MRRLYLGTALVAALVWAMAVFAARANAAPAQAPSPRSSPSPETFAQFQALPPAEQAARIQRAQAPLSRWRRFEAEFHDLDQLMIQSFRHEDLRFRIQPWREGLAGAVRDLTEATALDPSNVRAWIDLARCQAAQGDDDVAAGSLAAATTANATVKSRLRIVLVNPERSLGQPRVTARDLERQRLALEIDRAQAWIFREQGRWGDGMVAAARGLAIAPEDVELQVIRGLLLADSGRFADACAAARALPPIAFPRYGWNYTGLSDYRSDYASRWIEAMAWLRRGDSAQAFAVLGDLHPDRPRFPFMAAYWRDVALICEQAGRPRPFVAGPVPPPDDPLFWALFDMYAFETPPPGR